MSFPPFPHPMLGRGNRPGSVLLNGAGDYLSAVANAVLAFGSGDYTVECWVRPSSFSGSTLQVMFASGTTSVNNFYFHFNGTQLSVGTQAAFVSNQVTTFVAGTWYHVAACRSGGTLRLFRNGVQVGSNVADATSWLSDGTTQIGVGTASDYVLGNISNLRVEKGFARYTSNFTPPAVALSPSVNTSLLTCQGDGFRDNGPSALAITPHAAAALSTLNPF